MDACSPRREPPFDGSAPCPACPVAVRALFAAAFNLTACVRAGDGVHALEHVVDLRLAIERYRPGTDTPGALAELRAAVGAFLQELDDALATGTLPSLTVTAFLSGCPSWGRVTGAVAGAEPIVLAHYESPRHATPPRLIHRPASAALGARD